MQSTVPIRATMGFESPFSQRRLIGAGSDARSLELWPFVFINIHFTAPFIKMILIPVFDWRPKKKRPRMQSARGRSPSCCFCSVHRSKRNKETVPGGNGQTQKSVRKRYLAGNPPGGRHNDASYIFSKHSRPSFLVSCCRPEPASVICQMLPQTSPEVKTVAGSSPTLTESRSARADGFSLSDALHRKLRVS